MKYTRKINEELHTVIHAVDTLRTSIKSQKKALEKAEQMLGIVRAWIDHIVLRETNTRREGDT